VRLTNVDEQENKLVAELWDAEYRAGRYADEPPLAFVDVIGRELLSALALDEQVLYVGCGNGRNYVRLVEHYGLDVIGLDISAAAITGLKERMPERADKLIHGDTSRLGSASFGAVVGIQVFQHGLRAETHAHLRSALSLLRSGGSFCLRVNAVGTELEHRHRIVESHQDGGFTVHYQEGPKNGLSIHFFSLRELESLTSDLSPIVAPIIQRTERLPPASGHWDQWEGIWRKP
jgi:SAM-dependent methyltransferase